VAVASIGSGVKYDCHYIMLKYKRSMM
jgi:hypothetical protein